MDTPKASSTPLGSALASTTTVQPFSISSSTRERRLEAEIEQYRLERIRLESELRTASAKAGLFENKVKRVQNENKESQDKIRLLEQDLLRLQQTNNDARVAADEALRDLQEQFEIERKTMENALEEAGRREEEIRTQERLRSAELQAARESLEQEKKRSAETLAATTAKKKRPRRGETNANEMDPEDITREEELIDLKRRVHELEAENRALEAGAAVTARLREMQEDLEATRRSERKLKEEVKLLSKERLQRLEMTAKLAEVEAQLSASRNEIDRLLKTDSQVSHLMDELNRWRSLFGDSIDNPSDAALRFAQTESAMLDMQSALRETRAAKDALERALESCQSRVKDLENALAEAKSAEAACKKRCDEAERKLNLVESERSAAEKVLSSMTPSSLISGSSEQLKVLAEENKLLSQHLEAARKEVKELEFHAKKYQEESERLQKSLGQGAFDPQRTRVVHVKPTMRADYKAPNASQPTASAAAAGAPPLTSLMEKGADSEKHVERLKTLFSKQIRLYKEAVFLLFGWKLEMVPDDVPQLRLKSMFAERPDDFLMFRMLPETSTLELLETEYVKSIAPAFLTYLVRANSPPAFLASLQLELFSLQTHAM